MASLVRRLAKSLVPRKLRSRIMSSLVPQGDWRGVMDLRGVTDDPVAACYMAHRSSPVIDVPLSRCIGFDWIGTPFEPRLHPFISTVIAMREGRCESYLTSPLCDYHRSYQPHDAFEVLGVDRCERMLKRGFADPWAAVSPWMPDIGALRPEHMPQTIRKTAASDYAKAGLRVPKGATLYMFGPFDEETGQVEYDRLVSLHERIGADGLQRSDAPQGDITGIVLLGSDGTWRVQVRDGQHRAAVASSLGMDRIPIRLFPMVSSVLIRRDEVLSWPHVCSGLFTPEQALAVFDRLLSGVPSSGWAADAT